MACENQMYPFPVTGSPLSHYAAWERLMTDEEFIAFSRAEREKHERVLADLTALLERLREHPKVRPWWRFW